MSFDRTQDEMINEEPVADDSHVSSHSVSPKKRKKSKHRHLHSASPDRSRDRHKEKASRKMKQGYQAHEENSQKLKPNQSKNSSTVDHQVSGTDEELEVGNELFDLADDNHYSLAISDTSTSLPASEDARYSGHHAQCQQKEPTIDIRKKIANYAKEKIASRYAASKKCKKHNKGHKKSNKQDVQLTDD